MSVDTGDRVTRIYGNFRGVDFRGEEINLSRSPDSKNVWRDYKKTDSICTRPALSLFMGFDDAVHGVWYFKDALLVHSGSALYQVKNGEKTVLKDDIGNKCIAFVWGDAFYILFNRAMYQYKNNNMEVAEFYVPVTSIGRRPVAVGEKGGGGTVHEDVNMFTQYRINTFLGDGKSRRFNLDRQDIAYIEPVVTVNGNPVPRVKKVDGDTDPDKVINWQWNRAEGYVEFSAPEQTHTGYIPPAPDTDGQDNVSIKFAVPSAIHTERITDCTIIQVFDNRVFASGNPNFPNRFWHSSLDNPTYWSDLDYYDDGNDNAAIKALVAGNNALWVFREPSQAHSSIFYHTPTIDQDYGKIYPSEHSSIATGCVGKAINFNDDIVFFSERGMEGISGDVTTEQAVMHRSTLVDRKLTSEDDYKNMHLAEWNGYLMVFIGNKVYLADSRKKFTNEDHIEYEFYYWELSKSVNCVNVVNGELYVGTDDGIYQFRNIEDIYKAIEDGEDEDDFEHDFLSYWTTPKDKFNAPSRLKTTNKRGCVAEASGDVEVLVKVKDTGFESIGTYADVTDYFVSRIKRKKWKDIQLKFQSHTRFSLETATLEAFVGGYIKR